jgi:hypothetical protein
MPYITQARRDNLDPLGPFADNPGELNYQITRICIRYIEAQGLRYAHINDVLGALEGAKLEFYRRVAVPYENTKIGDPRRTG